MCICVYTNKQSTNRCGAVLGHDSGGQHAPGRTVDPAREVYKVAHHMLIAHGRTYQMYQ